MLYRIIAEAVLIGHFLFVLFVILGLVLIAAGGVLDWRWVRHRVFRITHLLAISFVVLQTWLGMICPLTHIENWARSASGEKGYESSFIAHWVEQLLYYEAPWWVFLVAYTAFGATVAATWYLVPPQDRKSQKTK